MKSIIYFVILLTYFRSGEVDTKRILGVFPLDFRSHNIFFEAIMKRLAKDGYEIDIISHYELSNPPQNYKTVINLAKLDFPYPVTKFRTIQHAIDSIKDPINVIEVYGVNMCQLLGHKKMQEFIQNPPKYDLIIVQGYTVSCFFGLGRIFNVPVITATPCLEFPWISKQIGNPSSTAIFSTLFMMKAEVKTFWDRLQNTVQTHIALQRFFSGTEQPHTEAMRKFLSPDMPNIREIEQNVALSLVNSHRTLQGIRPTTPNLIEVAGLHIDEDHSNFTTELQKWMDESKDGVVYIAFGTLVPIESLSNDTILAMMNSFSKIAPTRVLIKANKSKFPVEMPKNVKSMTWIPQIPVLRHNNTRAFITHGGLHSIQEAVHFGIPVIGVPLFFDQRKNVNILVHKKMGLQLSHDKITEKCLDEALRKILKNPKYREAAKYHSRLFRDRPIRPMDTAIYWIEYVIRNGGKPLRSLAADLYWWQNELLDVYAFLLFCLILVFFIILIALKIAVKLIFRKNLKIQLKRD